MFRKSKRRIIYNEFAKQVILDKADEHKRLYEVMKFFEWLLERQPENEFAQQQEPPFDEFWLIKSEDIPLSNIPSVRLLYRFNDEHVEFWGLSVE